MVEVSSSTTLGKESDQVTSDSPCAQPIEFTLKGNSAMTTRGHETKKKWFDQLRNMLKAKGDHMFDAFAMLVSNQMSQTLLLLPYCVAKLGWWRATLLTALFALLSCWTAHLVQFFYFRYYRSEDDRRNEDVQWDELLYRSFRDRGLLKYIWVIGLGFNCLCLFMRSAIQLTYAVSITYFVNGKIKKIYWTIILAVCCWLFALFPSLRKYRIFSVLSIIIATVAAVSITVASGLYKPDNGVNHSVSSNSFHTLAWVSGIIVYAVTDTSASVETSVVIKEWRAQLKFKYMFCGSMMYATLLSLLEALISYWSFGNELSVIHLGAQPCPLVVLRPSKLRHMASIFLLLLELVAIGNTLNPIITYLKKFIMYLKKILKLQDNQLCKCNHLWDGIACTSIVGLVCMVAIAIPFLGSMEITSLTGSFIVSLAIYIIPAAAHMLYLQHRRHRRDVALSSFWLIMSYMINIIQTVGVLVWVAVIGGGMTGLNKVFRSHYFHASDFWNKCYLCGGQSQRPVTTN